MVLCFCGISLNYRFWAKLEYEKRIKPVGRKGNVIEPIMRLFCWVQIFFYPYQLLFHWLTFNGLMPTDTMPSWLCSVLLHIMVLGRSIIGYNSLFVALIRYIYIVHQQKSNQWNFENLGKWFQRASIFVPFLVNIIFVFTFDPSLLSEKFTFKECTTVYNGTTEKEHMRPATLVWTMQYLPGSLIYMLGLISFTAHAVVLLNLSEAFLYIRIFQAIRR